MLTTVTLPFCSYYTANQDVLLDQEMQSFANEISAEVMGHDSGKGKVVCAKK